MNNSNSTSPPLLIIDELLTLAGFIPFDLITWQFVFAFFCFLSLLVFFSRKKASNDFRTEPVYVYFKVMSIIYLIHSLGLIPHGFCFTAKYFPQMDCHACIIFQLVYMPFSNIFFHYTGVLELAVVLDRMKVSNLKVYPHNK